MLAAGLLGLVLIIGVGWYMLGGAYPADLQRAALVIGLITLIVTVVRGIVASRPSEPPKLEVVLPASVEPPIPPELPSPVKPIRWTEPHAEMEASDFLNWRTRLSKTLVGREAEKKELLEWVKSGSGVEVRFLSGLGGAGKTRLAFEVADSLREGGWKAGEAEEKAAELLSQADHRRLFLIVDYPEDDPDRTKAILQALVDLPPEAGPVRALFVSWYTKERWETEIGEIDSKLLSVRPARRTLTLLKLTEDQAVAVFENSVERCAGALGKLTPEIPEQSIREWLRKGRDKDLFHLPLFVSAAAVHCVLNDAQVVDLSAAEVMTALVKRETRRMRGFGKEDGASQANPLVERLVALATVRTGLNVEALRDLGKEPPEGLVLPNDVLEWIEPLDWWSERARALQPLRPDALGAALVFEVLKNRTEDAPEWLWAVLGSVPEKDRPTWLAAAERIDYDIRRVYGDTEDRFAQWLAAMVAGARKRAEAMEYVTYRIPTKGTHELSKVLDEVLLTRVAGVETEVDTNDSAAKEATRAVRLNNYSVHLSEQGKAAEALEAIEEAVKIHGRLAQQTPERYEPDLAFSLSVLGDRREEAGEIGKAMEHCEEALRLFRKNQEGAPGFVGRYLPVVERDLERLRGKLGEDG